MCGVSTGKKKEITTNMFLIATHSEDTRTRVINVCFFCEPTNWSVVSVLLVNTNMHINEGVTSLTHTCSRFST